MLRICYCLSQYLPIASGAERQAHLQARELTRRGHQVQVITRAVAGCPEQEVLHGVTVHRVIRPIEMGPVFGLSFVAGLCAGLWRLRESFDLVHCHQGLWEAVATGLVRNRLVKPSVVQPAAGGEFGEIHQLSQTRGQSLLRRYILRNTHFVAISAQIQQELSHFGVPAERLTRLASGVDVEAFSPGESCTTNELPPRPRVLFLGRLHAQKNLKVLLAAWQIVQSRVRASLILAGDGPERNSLLVEAKRLRIEDSVHFVGAVQNPVDYLRAADIYVLPSVAEGMSNSLLEAMAVQLPVVASRIGGNSDLVVDGESGLLVSPTDVLGWAEALIGLLRDPDGRLRMGGAARAAVSVEYAIGAVVDQYVKLYEWLLTGRRS